jgi:AraC-like DNA-binding protein
VESNSFRFSTADLPAEDRLQIWRDVFGRQVVKVDMEPIGDGPFYSDADIRLLPDLVIATVNSSANRITRSRQLVDDGGDDFILGFLTKGHVVASQGHREASFSAGEAILWSNASTGGCHYPVETGFISLSIPRAILAPAVADLDKMLMTVIPQDTGALRLLAGYLQLLLPDLAQMPPELQSLSIAHVHDLVALTLGATRDSAEIARRRGLRAVRLRAIEADIIANIASRDLSIDALAARHGISARYIRSLFQSENTSFTDFVLKQRLARAYRYLTNPQFTDLMISTIAFESGFGDLSYFNHAFRRQYGMTPSDARAQARQQREGG